MAVCAVRYSAPRRLPQPQISEGPYTEAKEMVGGLFIIEAESRDEATRLAAMHPAVSLGEVGGWGIELIPMDSFLG
ncbi:MAG: YciI family protein [Hydrogenophaga sp.]|nr:YciI family protein [Hydrogenophaga sp.]